VMCGGGICFCGRMAACAKHRSRWYVSLDS
jgi:hypothetical protein